jgi:hypothetical protein
MSGIYSSIRPLLPDNALLAGLVASIAVVAAAVFINVVQQLVRNYHPHSHPWCHSANTRCTQLPLRSKNAPPMVFHYFPIIGSAVTYGMDPYKFMFENRKKVRLHSLPMDVPCIGFWYFHGANNLS